MRNAELGIRMKGCCRAVHSPFRIPHPALALGVFVLSTFSRGAGAQEVTPLNASMGAGNHRVWLSIGEHMREYLVKVPMKYDHRYRTPVLLMFHGSGGSADETYKVTGWDVQSEEQGYIVVYPNGFPNDEGMRVWNDGRAGRQSPVDDVAFTRAMLDDLQARFSVDPKRIYVVGFSNGASLSYRLAQELGDRIAAIAPVAGRIPNEKPQLTRAVPVFAVVGTKDGGYQSDTRAVEDWATLVGCGQAADTSRNGRYMTLTWRCPQDMAVQSTIVDNWAHYWPGGMINKGVEMWAEEKIWKFFRKYPLK